MNFIKTRKDVGKKLYEKKDYKIKSCILGHTVADALGVPVEFKKREELDLDPVVDMREYGTYNLPKGYWSDDTSMTLCALDSLANGYVNYGEIMSNFYKWFRDGEYTPAGSMFDIGFTCRQAISNYRFLDTPPLECDGADESSNGNGSLMRILPFVLYHEFADCNEDLIEFIHKASGLTHTHIRSKIGCGIYALIIRNLLQNPSKESVFKALTDAKSMYSSDSELHHYDRIFADDFANTPRNKIKSSGYVIDTLEAAIWCLLTTDNYKYCVLKAVNLGEDTDTVAAVAGGMAGLLYGYDNIPTEWLKALKRRDYIEAMCKKAGKAWRKI